MAPYMYRVHLWARKKFYSRISVSRIQRRPLTWCTSCPRHLSVTWPLLVKPKSSKGHVAFHHIHKLCKFKASLSYRRGGFCSICTVKIKTKTPHFIHIFRTAFMCILWTSKQITMKNIYQLIFLMKLQCFLCEVLMYNVYSFYFSNGKQAV
jgi:transposase